MAPGKGSGDIVPVEGVCGWAASLRVAAADLAGRLVAQRAARARDPLRYCSGLLVALGLSAVFAPVQAASAPGGAVASAVSAAASATASATATATAASAAAPLRPATPPRVALPAAARLDAQAESLARQAWQGFQRGDAQPALSALPALRGSPLEPWVAYWALQPRLQQASEADFDAYASAWPGSLPLRLLREQWLKQLAQRRDWPQFLSVYAGYHGDDSQLECLAAQARHAAQGLDTSQQVLQLWRSDPAGGYGCNAAAKDLLRAGLIDQQQLWQRLRDFFAADRQSQAMDFLPWLPAAAAAALRRAADDPLGVALHAVRHGIGAGALQRRMLVLALLRMAHADPRQAMQLIQGPLRELPVARRTQIAWVAARTASVELLPQADVLFGQARALGAAWQPDTETWKWCLRAALRAADWKLAVAATRALLQADGQDAEALYWHAVALSRTGHVARARLLWRGLAQPWSYYGQLATEALGRPLRIPAGPLPVLDGGQMLAQSRNVDVQRALLLYRIGAYAPAAWQWNFALRSAGDPQLHAAAQLACSRRAWLLCIWASDRMQHAVDWRQRYVMPFRSAVQAASRSSGVGQALIYGIMRQESRFAAGIRSYAGADGLMQLMPGTADWVARKLGLARPDPDSLSDVRTNLILGSAYLGMLLQRFDGSQAMAAAGYNAGPVHSQRWRAMPLPGHAALDGPVFVESIPFTQTRNYVKRVLANATVYAALLDGRSQSLQSRLALVDPRRLSDTQPMP